MATWEAALSIIASVLGIYGSVKGFLNSREIKRINSNNKMKATGKNIQQQIVNGSSTGVHKDGK
ncbi:hypothetical protein [Lactiplantibacillus mudanjiangensis]|uniref:Uncharacterized protein n=1 Tax=Lactiplantibacillus mudanjiangensis TaxID=1296538 RepID=A0A660DYY2_9LACO|nr:hypothetical protein [Lactiplantibacillus mudanjiangensis]VDG22710.1 hypothetical protein [Lactobacillus koreensis] [Lactiplantibacillus mudanjiangensis]VDG26752.1 hypothetical protein [Lactobacillus koreensis] [Lactiplantibacillus mudanjiangensis]